MKKSIYPTTTTRLVLLWWALAGALPDACAVDPWDFLQILPVSDGNPTTDDRGWANSHINAVPFKRQSLTTVGDYQFTSYYGADDKLVVGRRNLVASPGTWDLSRTEFTSYNINDAHNTSSIAIDGDGFLHVAWGVHGNPLLYSRSITSVLNDNSFQMTGGSAGNPGSITGALPFQGNGVTYPEFTNIPGSGDLLANYRLGGSGNGEWQLARWNNETDVWTSVHTALNSGNTGSQPWIDNDFSGDGLPNVNAYPNGLVFDSTGRLHATWSWRTGGDSSSGFTDYQTNHHVMYAYSDNQGVDWYRDDGTLYERNGVHDIDEDNATPVVLIPEGSSLINATNSATAPNNHYYMATYWAPEASQGNHLRQIMLVEYDGAEWTTHQVGQRNPEFGNNRIPESQLRNYPLRRPIVLTDDDDRVILVYADYQRGGGVSVAYSESAGHDDWNIFDLTTENLGTWSPTYDLNRWQNDGVLSLYYQPMGLGQAASQVSVLEWDARAYFATNPPPPPPPPPPVVVFREEFDEPSVPANWIAQSGSAGTATLGILDDTDGINAGNALSIASDTRQGVIGSFDEVSLANVGDKIELSFDVRLTQFPNNSGGFRFGLYHDNEGLALSSGYRVLVGTGANSPSTDVQADGGDDVNGDIAFGTNRENPPGFQSSLTGITDSDLHPFILTLTRTVDGMLIDVLQDGVMALNAPVEHVPGTGAGTSTPLQTTFNQIVFTTNGGILALIDNVQVTYLDSTLSTLPGDYNGDGVVDTADYTLWRDTLGQSVALGAGADGNANGQIDEADYEIWKSHFGANGISAVPGSAATVAEPAALCLAMFATSVALSAASRRQNCARRITDRCA